MSIQPWITRHRLEIAIFVFALVVRLVLIAIAPHQELTTYWLGSDGDDYANEAQNLVTGHGFTRADGPPYIPDASRTPLYPLALAGTHLLFGSFIPIIFFEAIVSSLLPIIFIRTAELFVRKRKIIILGALFVALEPDLVYNTIFFASESLSIILLSWGLLEILRMAYKPPETLGRQSFLASVGLGFATLARPITVYLWVFLLPLFVYQGYITKQLKPFLKAFVIFVAVFALILAPWVVRNYRVFGNDGMSTNGWFNMYTRLAVTVVSIDNGQDFYTTFYQMLNKLSTDGYIHHPPPVAEIEVRDPRFNSIFRTETINVIREHPRAFLIFMITAPISVLTQDNTLGYASGIIPFNYSRPSFSATLYASQHGVWALIKAVAPYLIGPYIVPYIMRALFTVLFILSVGGTVLLWRRGERFAALLLFGWIVYVVIFSINAGGQITGRYRAQFLIAEVTLACIAMERLAEARWHLMRSKLALWRSEK